MKTINYNQKVLFFYFNTFNDYFFLNHKLMTKKKVMFDEKSKKFNFFRKNE